MVVYKGCVITTHNMYEIFAQKDSRAVPLSCSVMDCDGISMQRERSWRDKAYRNSDYKTSGVKRENQGIDIKA